MKGFSLACAAACVLASVSADIAVASGVLTPAPHGAKPWRPAGPAAKPPENERREPGATLSDYASSGAQRFAHAEANNGGKNSMTSQLGGDGGGFPQPQPTPEAASVPSEPLILVAPLYLPDPASDPQTASAGSGSRIIYINRDTQRPATGSMPQVIYGDTPARRASGPEIIYGDSWK